MTEEQKHRILVQEYSNLPETQSFLLKSGGRIHATKKFVYLGTQMHFTLRDTYDMDCCITKAGQMMGALRFFWSRPEIDLRDKFHIYNACVISILLWGAET